MAILVTSKVLDQMREAGVSAAPCEACGLLLGEGDVVMQFALAANVHPTPETHFEIDPQALIDAYREERGRRQGQGVRVLGYFHSHPRGPSSPSATDAAMAARDGKIWAISGDDEVKFWRDTPSGFEALSYTVIAP